jgi:hypothetical protein
MYFISIKIQKIYIYIEDDKKIITVECKCLKWV